MWEVSLAVLSSISAWKENMEEKPKGMEVVDVFHVHDIHGCVYYWQTKEQTKEHYRGDAGIPHCFQTFNYISENRSQILLHRHLFRTSDEQFVSEILRQFLFPVLILLPQTYALSYAASRKVIYYITYKKSLLFNAIYSTLRFTVLDKWMLMAWCYCN